MLLSLYFNKYGLNWTHMVAVYSEDMSDYLHISVGMMRKLYINYGGEYSFQSLSKESDFHFSKT